MTEDTSVQDPQYMALLVATYLKHPFQYASVARNMADYQGVSYVSARQIPLSFQMTVPGAAPTATDLGIGVVKVMFVNCSSFATATAPAGAATNVRLLNAGVSTPIPMNGGASVGFNNPIHTVLATGFENKAQELWSQTLRLYASDHDLDGFLMAWCHATAVSPSYSMQTSATSVGANTHSQMFLRGVGLPPVSGYALATTALECTTPALFARYMSNMLTPSGSRWTMSRLSGNIGTVRPDFSGRCSFKWGHFNPNADLAMASGWLGPTDRDWET